MAEVREQAELVGTVDTTPSVPGETSVSETTPIQETVAEEIGTSSSDGTESPTSGTDSTTSGTESPISGTESTQTSTQTSSQPDDVTTVSSQDVSSGGHETEMTHSTTEQRPGIDDEEPRPDNLTEILSGMSNDSDTVVSEITSPESGNSSLASLDAPGSVRKCDRNMEYVSNPEDCRTYFKCVGEEPLLMHCPSGLYWTPSDTSCTSDGFLTCGQHDTQSNGQLGTPSATRPQGQMSSSQQQFFNACHQICMTNSKTKNEQEILTQPDYELSYYVCRCMNHAHPSA